MSIQAMGMDYTPDTVPERETVKSYRMGVVICRDPMDHFPTDLAVRIRKAAADG